MLNAGTHGIHHKNAEKSLALAIWVVPRMESRFLCSGPPKVGGEVCCHRMTPGLTRLESGLEFRGEGEVIWSLIWAMPATGVSQSLSKLLTGPI